MSASQQSPWSPFRADMFTKGRAPRTDSAARAWAGEDGEADASATGGNVIGIHEALAGTSALAAVLNVSGTPSDHTHPVPRSGARWEPCGGQAGCVGVCGGGCAHVASHALSAMRLRGHERPDLTNGAAAAPDGRLTGAVINEGPMPSGQYLRLHRMTGGHNAETRRAARPNAASPLAQAAGALPARRPQVNFSE